MALSRSRDGQSVPRKPAIQRLMPQRRQLAAVILAAGQGTRMKSARPKVLHPLAGRSMVRHVLAAVAPLKPDRTVVVVAPGMDAVAREVAPASTAVQDRPLGTGHAVRAARSALRGFAGDVLVIYGDTPLIRPTTLKAMLRARRARRPADLVALGFRAADPKAYGRLILDDAGRPLRIVEARDASAAERAVDLCNAGPMLADARRLFDLLGRIGNRNAQREYYLTDLVALARAQGLATALVEASEAEVQGINSRSELAAAELALQKHYRAAAMANGATLVDPDTVWFAADTRLGRDVTIEPNVVFGPGVTVGNNVRIRAFSHLEGARTAPGAIVGPFARLRPGAAIETDAHIGNFVEVKNARIERGAKVNHLTYIGDARVGARANVGAGTITCNYDGFAKHFTDIGRDAFIGSNTALVAPVKVGAGAVIGAGSVIARDVPRDALAVERAEQKVLPGGAARLRARKRKAKKG